MKEIKAIIQPFMLQAVCDALLEIEELPGLTVSPVLGIGRARAIDHPNESSEHAVDKRTKIEVVVPDELIGRVADAIATSARTGKPGDGKLFILDVSAAQNIRSGKRGQEAR